MILIPDKNVLFVMKEGNLSIEDIRLRIMTNKDYTHYEISFDGKNFMPFRKNMKIPSKYYNLKQMQITLRCKEKGKQLAFLSEKLPVKVFTMLGDMIEDLYPVAIQRVLNMEQSILEKIIVLENKLKELEELGEL